MKKQRSMRGKFNITIMVIVFFYAVILMSADTRVASNRKEASATAESSTEEASSFDESQLETVEIPVTGDNQLPISFVEIDDVKPNDPNISTQELIDNLPEGDSPDDWNLMIVNGLRPLSDDLPIDFAYTSNGMRYDARIESAYNDFTQAAADAGYPLTLVSSYRSIDEQTINRLTQRATLAAQGVPEEDLDEQVNDYMAPANCSEHSTGLAFDWLDNNWVAQGRSLDPDYRDEDGAKWMAENAPNYGFILRYVEGKEDQTGYNFEPWHFRYVGRDAAQYITKYGLTLEEYVTLLYARDGKKVIAKPDDSLTVTD